MSELFSRAQVFVIGASAGGIDALNEILPAFRPTNHFKVALVIHLPPDGPNLLPSLYSESCSLEVTEVVPGEDLKTDHIYVGPSDYHLCIEPNGSFTLSSEGPVNYSRPSIDVLFESAAYAYGEKVVGILLTGANQDGANGLKKIKELGGVTIVQDPKDAEYKMMPESALKIFRPDLVLNSKEIAKLITTTCLEGRNDGRK